MADANNKISLGEKLGYALGDAAANFVLQMRLAFLTYFYTDVYLIAPRTVAVIQLLSHVVDAFNDIVMGALSDRTETRWGKFRPWILWSASTFGSRRRIWCLRVRSSAHSERSSMPRSP